MIPAMSQITDNIVNDGISGGVDYANRRACDIGLIDGNGNHDAVFFWADES